MDDMLIQESHTNKILPTNHCEILECAVRIVH